MKKQAFLIKKAIKIVGGQAKLASECGCSQTAVSYWLNGKNRVSPKFAILIEKATRGFVTRQEICPNVFSDLEFYLEFIPYSKQRFKCGNI